MIMLEVTPGDPYKRMDLSLKNSISGIIGMAGSIKGLLAIHLPNQTALEVTTAFLGMDVENIDDDVRDAIGELANMLGGSLKSALDPKGSDIKLSMPSTICGEEYSIESISNADVVTVPFELEGNTFLIEFQSGPNS
jgi:chemotaxis protein CheX